MGVSQKNETTQNTPQRGKNESGNIRRNFTPKKKDALCSVAKLDQVHPTRLGGKVSQRMFPWREVAFIENSLKLPFQLVSQFAYRWSLPPPPPPPPPPLLLLSSFTCPSPLPLSPQRRWSELHDVGSALEPRSLPFPMTDPDKPQHATPTPVNTPPVSAVVRPQRRMVTGTRSPSEVHLTFFLDRQKSQRERSRRKSISQFSEETKSLCSASPLPPSLVSLPCLIRLILQFSYIVSSSSPSKWPYYLTLLLWCGSHFKFRD